MKPVGPKEINYIPGYSGVLYNVRNDGLNIGETMVKMHMQSKRPSDDLGAPRNQALCTQDYISRRWHMPDLKRKYMLSPSQRLKFPSSPGDEK